MTRRDQTILGLGLTACGALFLLSGTIADGLGLAIGMIGIVALGTRPGRGADQPAPDQPGADQPDPDQQDPDR